MVKLRHSANPRPRVRLLSTPKGSDPMTGVIEGIKFSDQLAGLLTLAREQGFRIEADTKAKGKPTSVIVYAPDKTISPITVAERGAKLNKAHFENIRRDLVRAGLVLPDVVPGRSGGGVIAAGSEAEARAAAPPGARMVNLNDLGLDLAGDADLPDLIADPENGPKFVATVVDAIASIGGYDEEQSRLAGSLMYATFRYFATISDDVLAQAAESVRAELAATYESTVNDAMNLAAEHEATALRATQALAKAEEREAAARADCGAAIERAKTAEHELAELRAVIEPFRALLGKADV